jgi:hypothetical protein
VTVGVGEVDSIAPAAGDRRPVLDPGGVEAGEQFVEIGAGADGEADAVEPGQGGRPRWVFAQGECDSDEPAVLVNSRTQVKSNARPVAAACDVGDRQVQVVRPAHLIHARSCWTTTRASTTVRAWSSTNAWWMSEAT